MQLHVYPLQLCDNRGCGAFASDAEGWMFESQPRQILVVKTGSDRARQQM